MTTGAELVGWLSGTILVPSLFRQTYTQWKTGTSKGVSQWLYWGSLTSSTGFVFYSLVLGNRVFIVTNSLLVLDNILGLIILYRHRRREASKRL